MTAPGYVPAGREVAGRPKPHGGGKPPPYRARERRYSTGRSRQDKIARAACRPPLRSVGNQTVCGGSSACRDVPAAGSKPRPTGSGNVVAAAGVRGKAKPHDGVRPHRAVFCIPFAGGKAGVSLPTFFAKKVGLCKEGTSQKNSIRKTGLPCGSPVFCIDNQRLLNYDGK